MSRLLCAAIVLVLLPGCDRGDEPPGSPPEPETALAISPCEAQGDWKYVGSEGAELLDSPDGVKCADLMPGIAVLVLDSAESEWSLIRSTGWANSPSSVGRRSDGFEVSGTLWSSPEGRYTWGTRGLQNALFTQPVPMDIVERRDDRVLAAFEGWVRADAVMDRSLFHGEDDVWSWSIESVRTDSSATTVRGHVRTRPGAMISARLELYGCDGYILGASDFGISVIQPDGEVPFRVEVNAYTGATAMIRLGKLQALFQ